ncbi:relaxase/mobilization nuclease domain-containing protein [Roseivivax sediminis]|uniref:Relaxase/Mobilisation nuclease domain-containing protein n=1 Tax=Roseivivax sediminis TaxID=936889 RepID=A0A1I2E4C4_9RHOB|nr:relaxase/mobilization nuclease domain-containing protein [Roseivivax sediminis]SFE87772.1 Relaxase/Mobilisation nuclease domain-containing protein [Roseivivax sediminis]
MSDRPLSVQDALIGYPLDELGRRSRSGDDGTRIRQDKSIQSRAIRAFSGNARRSPQSVVKRIKAGGCNNKKELTRQLQYITREDAAHATWTNFAGVDRDLRGNTIERAAEDWSSAWRGAPKRGHTDHIILSFPKGTNIEQAEAVAREWGQAMFASGDYGDQWRYVAAVHKDPDHIHAHFVVDKVGCDWGDFLSISMKSELNYDVMRERHAEIARSHGIDMVASNRLSRGIVEHAPRETEYRAVHAEKGRGDDASIPPMSDSERERRESIVQGFARQYASLGQLAAMSSYGNSFMEKLSEAFFRSSDTLEKGGSLMAEPDTLAPPDNFDPAVAMTEAHDQMVSDARQAWDNIQAMDAGPERAQMEAEFSRTSTELLEATQAEPFFQDHAATADASNDMFSSLALASAQHVRSDLDPEDPRASQIDSYLGDVRDALTAEFAKDPDLMVQMNTTPEEMAEYAVQGEHSVAQAEAWQDRAEALDEAGSERLSALMDEGHRIVDDTWVPRDLEEQMALDQIMTADKHHQLSDVPAIESLVDRMEEELSDDEVQKVIDGDSTPLQDEISDPAVRAAVASEMRNEADLSPEASAERETVEAYKDMAREHQAEVSHDHAVERTADLEDGHEL